MQSSQTEGQPEGRLNGCRVYEQTMMHATQLGGHLQWQKHESTMTAWHITKARLNEASWILSSSYHHIKCD
jgi:hypothetical protein